MEKIAIIDLGSNSARLVLVDILEGGYFSVVDQLKETVRLAQDMEDDGFLKQSRIFQAIKTFKMFRKLCDANKVDRIYAFATSAVRRAKNQRGFLDEILATTGIKVRVLDENEEAQLIYQGVINSLDVPRGIIMDIGGGGIQFIYYNRRNLLGHATLPIGAVTLTEMFAGEELSPEERNDKIYAYVRQQLDNVEWMNDIAPDTRLIGVGGSFRNLGKISRMLKKYPLDMAHNYVISATELQGIYANIKKLSLDKTMKIKGLSSLRADIFPAALAAVNAVTDKLGLEDAVISGCGLREGAMFRYAVPSTNEKPLSDVLGHSI